FKKDTAATHLKDYPINAHYGKVLKKGPEDYTDVRGLVVADYQEELEREWVADLRRKYAFKVNDDVLKTVNNH
ncbi:MAG: peptidylprolyl isomerase, partial [Prevotella sp.]|nr:peptidylprolyl isomerase [Prevotella sp.]